jgi:hypothetical protein
MQQLLIINNGVRSYFLSDEDFVGSVKTEQNPQTIKVS